MRVNHPVRPCVRACAGALTTLYNTNTHHNDYNGVGQVHCRECQQGYALLPLLSLLLLPHFSSLSSHLNLSPLHLLQHTSQYQSITNLYHKTANKKLGEFFYLLANEPSVGLYHVQEHIRKTIPKNTEVKVTTLPLPTVNIVTIFGSGR